MWQVLGRMAGALIFIGSCLMMIYGAIMAIVAFGSRTNQDYFIDGAVLFMFGMIFAIPSFVSLRVSDCPPWSGSSKKG